MTDDFSFSTRIYYEDTDAAGVVYHANYLKFMERARTEWLNTLGFPIDTLVNNHGILFTARHVEIDFLKPAQLNDDITINTILRKCRRASLIFLQEVYRHATLISRAHVKIACVDSEDLSPAAIPIPLLEQFKMMTTEGLTR